MNKGSVQYSGHASGCKRSGHACRVLAELWLYALFALVVMVPIVALLGVQWQNLGLTHHTYISLMSALKVMVILLLSLALGSLVFNAKFQYGEE